jgi:acryloyl-coenzyme A reductase
MKAVLLERFGGPDVLEVRDVEVPRPGPGEVLVRTRACGVCYHDVLSRAGLMRRDMKVPVILGHEVAGEVAEVGAGVTWLGEGDRVASTQRRSVCGRCRYCRTGGETMCSDRRFLGHEVDGGYAEYVVIGADNLAKIPTDIPFGEAAVMACAIGTGLNAIREVARVRAGETVLVTGAGGGLGVHAVQLARLSGARALAVTTSEEKVDRLRELGADEVIPATEGRFADDVRAVTSGEGTDVVIDNVGGKVFDEVRRSLARRGRLVMVGEVSSDFVRVNLAQLFLHGLELRSAVSTTQRQLEDVVALVGQGRIRPIVGQAVPLAEAAAAHQALEARRPFGRVVLTTE